mgnify:CR=1 FL=1
MQEILVEGGRAELAPPETRLLLAFVLMGAVMFLFQYLYPAPPAPPGPPAPPLAAFSASMNGIR